MAKCRDCKKEMTEADSCDFKKIKIDGKWFSRIRSNQKRCHDCGIAFYGIHHAGCDMERCPKCKGQMLSCNCDKGDLKRE